MQLFKTFIVAILANISLITFAQQNVKWSEGSGGGYTYKYVSGDPAKARFYTLKNGLTVILSPTNKDPRIQTFIAVKAGSKTDPSTNTGLAHYLEHMLFKGTDQFGTLDWQKEKVQLDKISSLYEEYNKTTDPELRKAIYRRIDSVSGVSSKYSIAGEYDKMLLAMGAQNSNAFTSFEQTVYQEDIPAASIDKFLVVQAERFRNPQLRIFHTELESVYEEKNRTLDDDGRKINERLFAELFKNHNYGRQTTIGTVAHLKNPSLIEIQKYYKTYYVPNNMAIIMAGDFNPDVVIKKIDNAFSYLKPGDVKKYTFEPEQPLTNPVTAEVLGPDAESVTIGYRLPGNKAKDILLADLIGQILTNGKAGLMDLNLVKKQKLLRASASAFTLIDHGLLYMRGNPTQGQSLEEVKDLIIGEIENLKKGNFDNDLITSIINNQKKATILALETYNSRAEALMNAYTYELDWRNEVAYVDLLSKLTKNDIVAFANKYFGNNYVVVYKRKGEDKNIAKIEKPAITPVETNANSESPFVRKVNNMAATPVKPVWVDYTKDLQKSKVGPAEVLYVQNKDNSIFRLRYRYSTGSYYDKKLPIAAQYLQYLGTDKMSTEEITKEFYKIASSFNVTASSEYTTVMIEGLQENFEKAVTLFENLMANCKPDENALKAFKARLLKSRADAKANKNSILSGLTSYARFGAKNPFNYVLSDSELNNITAQELVDLLHQLNQVSHQVLYYGPLTLPALTASVKKLHKFPVAFKAAGSKVQFTPVEQKTNQVLFADYNMVQAETRWVRNNALYNPADEALVNVFNNYFGGGGMSTVVFQTIREAKGLAYATFAFYVTPEKKDQPFYTIAYVGSQADKFNEAAVSMNQLLNELPDVPKSIAFSKESIKKDIETQRITQDGIILNYLAAKEKGLTTDIRKSMYESIHKIGYKELKDFHAKNIAGKPFTYAIVASESKINLDDVKKYGEFKKLTLEEIFGY